MWAALGKFLKNKAKDKIKDKVKEKTSSLDDSKQFLLKIVAASSGSIIPIIFFSFAVIIIVAAPIMFASEFSQHLKNGNTTQFFEKVGNLIAFKGWCSDSDGSCEKNAEQKYYEELKEASDKYNGKVDIELITATIFYGYDSSDYLYVLDDDGYNIKFINYFCEANGVGWAGEEICEIYVKNNYDEIYNEYSEKYFKIASDYENLRDSNCKDNVTLLSSLVPTVGVATLPIQYSLNYTISEACQFYLFNFADLAQVTLEDNSLTILYENGKNEVGELASEMVKGGILDYDSYKQYLINTYIPSHFSSLYSHKSDKNKAIEKIADEIMAFASGDVDGVTNYANSCSFNQSDIVDVNVDSSYIDSLYINVLNESCKKVNDCGSSDIEQTVSLKDYVVGVVYREIHATESVTEEETIKANIIAIKSYTLGRRKSTEENGKYYITMLNNTNDQVFCNINTGCLGYKSSNLLPALSTSQKEILYRLYDETANEFLYNTANNKFDGAYASTLGVCVKNIGLTTNCMSQTDATTMGKEGNDYKTILSAFYNTDMGILDIDTSTVSVGSYVCEENKTTTMIGSTYSTTAPRYDKSAEFFNNYVRKFYVGNNYGQCVWYARGRAQEIVYYSDMPDDIKQSVINTLASTRGNGHAWYSNSSLSIFNKSTDVYAAKPGSIVSWSGGSTWCSDEGMYCGHVAIIEDVKYDSSGRAEKVLLSETWNKGTATYSSTWKTIEQLRVYSTRSKYSFNGYVYLLD